MPSEKNMPCFHCQLPLPEGSNFFVLTQDNKKLPMCCPGCKAVTETILNLDLSQFYQYRDQYPNKAIGNTPPKLSDFKQLDTPEIYNEYCNTSENQPSFLSITLYIEGIACSACVWLIEHRLRQIKGIKSCDINLSSQQAFITWDKDQLALSHLFMEISSLGYKAHFYQVAEIEQHNKKANDEALKRIGASGLGSMQVMMIAVALYIGGFQSIEKHYQFFMQWISMMVTLPIFFYVGAPFFNSAIRAIRTRRLNMDVPISIALIIILLQSISNTFLRHGDIFFDSVSMFLFLLTLGRYLEMRVRHKASDIIYHLTKLLPTTAYCVELNEETIIKKTLTPINSLKKGDILLIEKDQYFPVDGVLLHRNTTVNESMLTGEFMPKSKKSGDPLYAGTKNILQDSFIKVTKTGHQTRLLSITQLLNKAQTQKPHSQSIANKISGYFTAFVLLTSLSVGFIWLFIDRSQMLSVMVSILVVSCPCALSLATPIVLTVSMNKLAKMGFLVLNNRVIEGLSTITHCVFDKTGTLTLGELTLTKIDCLSTYDENGALSLAASLESCSEHPIAQTLCTASRHKKIHLQKTTETLETLNNGVSGVINSQKYRIGKIAFSEALYANSEGIKLKNNGSMKVLLASEEGPIALFHFEDQLRPQAKKTIDWLKAHNIIPVLLSGDHSRTVKQVANTLGINQYHKDKTPQEKHNIIQKLSKDKNKVLIIGDGSNDALAMASAYLSFSMGAGTDLAKTSSDAVFLTNDLSLLKTIFLNTLRARNTIKQNISWAIIYNLIALPVAAMGMVQPYVAVIGMSISSLIVTLNALKLNRKNNLLAKRAPILKERPS